MGRRRIPQTTAEYARWLARSIADRYRPVWFEPDTALFLSMALEGYASWLDDHETNKLTFTVTAIDDMDHARVIAAADNIEVAWAAFSAATPKQNVGSLILHQRARLIARHPPDKNLKLLIPAPGS